jgi:hypothetical protein
MLKAVNVLRTGQMFCIIDKVGTLEREQSSVKEVAVKVLFFLFPRGAIACRTALNASGVWRTKDTLSHPDKGHRPISQEWNALTGNPKGSRRLLKILFLLLISLHIHLLALFY